MNRRDRIADRLTKFVWPKWRCRLWWWNQMRKYDEQPTETQRKAIYEHIIPPGTVTRRQKQRAFEVARSKGLL